MAAIDASCSPCAMPFDNLVGLGRPADMPSLRKQAKVEIFERNRPSRQALQRADKASVSDLLSRGVSANALDVEGTPALMAATLFADAGCVKLLLDRGANPNASNAAGATALMWALPDPVKSSLIIAAGG